MSSQKILIIVPDMKVQHILHDRLSALGHECFVHDDIFTAIDAVVRDVPDLIILDVSALAPNSFVFLETLRAHADVRVAATSVIIASLNGDLVEIGRALQFGVVDYFVKATIDADTVTAKIVKHLSTLKSEPIASTAPSAPLVQDNPGKMPKLLIIEDDQFLRDLATQKLRKEQLEVVSAMDGEKGIAMAEAEIPDVILLDILLPGIDGYEVLKRVRANPALQKTSIAMLSNFGQREDIEKALKAGADQFFVKANFTLDEIVEGVKSMLAKPRA